MDDVKQHLDLASSRFNAHKETITQINNDPVMRQWLALGFQAYATPLSFFDIEAATLVNAKNNYIDLSKKISAQFERCENELGNLKTDFAHQKGNNKQILAQLTEMRTECESTHNLITEFKEQAQIFRDADAKIRSGLSFNTMIPLARANAGIKVEMFNTGFELYTIATRDETQTNRESRLNELYIKAKEIEGAFERLEIPNLPGIAVEIIKFHINKAIKAAQKTKNFINEANKVLLNDIKPLKKIESDIEQCNKMDINDILKQSPKLIQDLSKSMMYLDYLSHLLSHLRFFSEQLDDLKLLHRVFRLDFLPDLSAKIALPDSLLNPEYLAERKANNFFSGFTGLIRTLKMLLASLSGKKVVSDLELKNKITDAIRHCPIYFSKKPDDVTRIEQFTDSYLDGYTKPFPHDSLFSILKNALAEYGDRVECFFDDYKIKPERATSTADPAPAEGIKPPANLNKLMKRIEKRLTTETKI